MATDESDSTIGTTTRSQFILLGASNLSLGLTRLLPMILRSQAGPSDIWIADGFGRSYGKSSRFFQRTLPGILDCGLWNAYAQHRTTIASSQRKSIGQTYAMLTDVGNDIGYGVEADQIIEWVTACMDRLVEMCNPTIVMTGLPVESLESLSPTGFRIAQKLLFPSSRTGRLETLQRARYIQNSLAELCTERAIPFITVQRDWYGLDPIHLQRRYRQPYWQSIVDSWITADGASATNDDTVSRPWLDGYLWTRWAHTRRVLGTVHRRLQPCGHLAIDSTLWVF